MFPVLCDGCSVERSLLEHAALLDMGYSDEMARFAVVKCPGNVEQQVDLLNP